MQNFCKNMIEIVGDTPILRINSLSDLCGSDIFLKCENLNPGGSIKDRAAKGMLVSAIANGSLKSGMTIVEGTAGNTGIGLALLGRSLGFPSLIVMPNNQSAKKVDMLRLYGAEVELVEPVAFANQNHFFHKAKSIALDQPKKFWWANQFDNIDNQKGHFDHTAPEIYEQLGGRLDYLVSVAGTGGTIAGNSRFLKNRIKGLKVVLCDPEGSGLEHYFHHGEFKATGDSFSEGIGIMRLVENFKMAQIDEAMTVADKEAILIANYLREHDGIVLGTSAALSVACAFKIARQQKKGLRLLTFWCDAGERSQEKLYNEDFLQQRGYQELLDKKYLEVSPFLDMLK